MDPKIIGAFVVAFSIAGGSFIFGYMQATDRYAPQIAQLRTKIDAADAAAKEQTKLYKENENAIANEINDSVGRINDKYDGMLQRGDKASARALAECAKAANGTAEELQAAYRDATLFRKACELDANTIVSWQHWATANGIHASE